MNTSLHWNTRIAMALIAVLGVAHAAQAQVSRSPWQMHEGQAVIKLDTELPPNGALPENGYVAFNQADIPAEGPGWVAAPNPDTIGFGGPNASKISAAGGSCRRAVDYTYFQTFVEVSPNARVDEFKIVFDGMDDASRITIFNSRHPGGTVVDGSYVTRASQGASTTDLKDLVAPGRNRVVITQVDWCPVGNQLKSAQVSLNGSTVVVDTPRPNPGHFVPTSHGDVHIRTLDGLVFDFQATGDFLLFQSTNGEAVIQARQEAWDKNPKVSVNRAAAIRVMGDVIEMYQLPELKFLVNGEPAALPTTRTTLPGGGAIEGQSYGGKSFVLIYWPNESLVARLVYYPNKTMDIEVRRDLPPKRTYEGLIGNLDGVRDNDFQVRGGEVLSLSGGDQAISRVGESWRLKANEALFGHGKPVPATAIAGKQQRVADLDPAARRDAYDQCKAAAIKDPMALSHCVYDVAATGDTGFIASAQQFQQTITALPPSEREAERPAPVETLAPAATGQSMGLFLPGEKLQRGYRYGMEGHYITFQNDGNLCVYTSQDNRFVWCINNDPAVNYANAAAVEMTRDGRLAVTDADGGLIWQAPATAPQSGSGVHLTGDGVLEIRAPSGALVWSSRTK
ncbi:MAG TPA: VWD domain-containing protein [Chiayiivirga sp.]|nr:VWD domain-containing protein [Chiayiivirga sp.]